MEIKDLTDYMFHDQAEREGLRLRERYDTEITKRTHCSYCGRTIRVGEMGYLVHGDRTKFQLPKADKNLEGYYRCKLCRNKDRIIKPLQRKRKRTT